MWAPAGSTGLAQRAPREALLVDAEEVLLVARVQRLALPLDADARRDRLPIQIQGGGT
jgi:hypothetical protein